MIVNFIDYVNFIEKKTKENSRSTHNNDDGGNDDGNADSANCELEEVTENRLLNIDEYFSGIFQ